MKKAVLLTTFFVLTPILIFFSILHLLYLAYHQNNPYLLSQNSTPRVAFAALPSAENVLGDHITAVDARVEMVRQFFEKYKSPLEPFAQNVIDSADEYSLDFRLIPAIAMQESNLCRKIIIDSYNCWGFGIYGKTVTRFTSYEEGIETVTKTLAKNYKQNGLETPEEIMSKYTPSSNGSWAASVNYFMEQLQ